MSLDIENLDIMCIIVKMIAQPGWQPLMFGASARSDSDPQVPTSGPGRLRRDRQDLSPRATHNSTITSPFYWVFFHCTPALSSNCCHCPYLTCVTSSLFISGHPSVSGHYSILYVVAGAGLTLHPKLSPVWWGRGGPGDRAMAGPVLGGQCLDQPPLPGHQPVSGVSGERATHTKHSFRASLPPWPLTIQSYLP